MVEQDDSIQFFTALQSGATGYIKKGFSEFELPEMIRGLQNGGALIEPAMIRKLVEYFHTLPSKTVGLGHTEQQLLHLFYEGLTYKESADRLGISVDGIKYYVKNIYRKLGVNKKIDALRMFREQMNSN
ncbi:MAG: response regulator transcription factor [Lewinellaceae bacterium]|nr:response regulator transcription factor [Lewinellaceae bacterium]